VLGNSLSARQLIERQGQLKYLLFYVKLSGSVKFVGVALILVPLSPLNGRTGRRWIAPDEGG